MTNDKIIMNFYININIITIFPNFSKRRTSKGKQVQKYREIKRLLANVSK